MTRRKRVGLITICPENDYQQRVMTGIFNQCRKYDYDVFVFSPMVQVTNFYKSYLAGELNIYNLINFDELDGVIITPLPMTEDRVDYVVADLLAKIKKQCKKPVVSVDLKFGKYSTVLTNDRTAFYYIAEHLIKKHNCKNFSVLTGMKDYSISEARLKGVKDALKENKLKLNPEQIYYGDFWYTSGEKLAGEIACGNQPKPDAVICASDHMAIGLTNALIKNGVKVPEDVIVTGYEAIREASLNNPPITSYSADEEYTAAMAVNELRSLLEPDSELIEPVPAGEKNLCIGETCGCKEDENYTRERLKNSQYSLSINFNDNSVWEGIDIGMLLESYTTEILTATSNPAECLLKIYESKYLIRPYEYLYLCLNQHWLNSDRKITEGYEEKMNQAIFADRLKQFPGNQNHVFVGKDREVLFDVKQMLPDFALKLETQEPQVYYFSPVHFNEICLGYMILQNNLSQSFKIGTVYRNWIRIITNGLEMTRVKYRIESLSEHDMMTGLYNRRGMEHMLSLQLEKAEEDDTVFAFVIDMDGLKLINDNYGHSQGDRGINVIASAVTYIARNNEISVRGGGDEFYLIGIGKYSKAQIEEKIGQFKAYLLKENKKSDIPLNASIGYAMGKISDFPSSGIEGGIKGIDEILEKADVNMYLDKRQKKIRRFD